MAKDELSGADIKVCGCTAQPVRRVSLCPAAHPTAPPFFTPVQAVCTEAGMLALRERRMKVTQDDFRKAKEKALYRKKENLPQGLYM